VPVDVVHNVCVMSDRVARRADIGPAGGPEVLTVAQGSSLAPHASRARDDMRSLAKIYIRTHPIRSFSRAEIGRPKSIRPPTQHAAQTT